jgi:hypothetical protein
MGPMPIHFAFLARLVALMGADRLNTLVADQVNGACAWPDEKRDGLLNAIRQAHGPGVLAILIYGSYLRGKRDTLLDFYVLLENYSDMPSRWQGGLAWLLSPNVYQVHDGVPPDDARAKYALMTMGRFEYTMRHDFHSYFWARFAQPSGLLYCRDDSSQTRVINAISQASSTFVRRVLPRCEDRFNARDLISTGLSNTYRCELRSEPPGHAEALYGHNENYYRAMVAALADENSDYQMGEADDAYINHSSQGKRRRSVIIWGLRRLHGKVLSVLRLLKAVLTFDRGFEYLLWKIGRHSNVYIEPTPRQRKYPLIFGWSLIWQLYRRGAFR